MNLYVHFPFCRRKCAYCALHSRAGASAEVRAAYVRDLAAQLARRGDVAFDTVYFGGGTPALCDLGPLFDALALAPGCEFTVELHPLDVTPALLATLRAGGVNRISLGVQALDDATLRDMGRGYTAAEAARAFARVKTVFDNAGIDLIAGYPGAPRLTGETLAPLAEWGLRHGSVYSLILEEKSLLAHRPNLAVPSDDDALDDVRRAADFLASLGLARYEIANFAQPGFECRHNLAVWRGEDYVGLGEGAFGREGLVRTGPDGTTRVTPEEDRRERTIFRLRTREGLETADYPAWRATLDGYVAEGLLTRKGTAYFLTPRGAEVCDSLLVDL